MPVESVTERYAIGAPVDEFTVIVVELGLGTDGITDELDELQATTEHRTPIVPKARSIQGI
jgi:hypothetical protein